MRDQAEKHVPMKNMEEVKKIVKMVQPVSLLPHPKENTMLRLS
jgi:desulfoferrodoxin (superoxide reductase-like protein)